MENKNKALQNLPDPERADQNKLRKNTRFIELLQKDIDKHQAYFEAMKPESRKTKEVKETQELSSSVEHAEILSLLIEQIVEVRFREVVGLTDESQKLAKKHYLVCCIENVLETAHQCHWGICRHHNFIYLYNSQYWSLIDKAEIEGFLGVAAEKMGVDKYDARHSMFREQLFKQFLAVANLPKPVQSDEVVYINLLNGTFEISTQKQILRQSDRHDFMTYHLPFGYDVNATCPMFDRYLNTVLPDKERQYILAEYLGSLFIKSSRLQLEKALLLYGSGANGKSVFFEIVNALLGGTENVSSYSLQALTNENGYYRAMLANKLVNYASEINGKLETSIFKQLVSGEPVEARLPYGDPFTMTDYAKLIFNCNELPKDVEQTPAYFRRLLIIPFDVTIPEGEQDKELARKIIGSELSGVFNWILEGLKRLLSQKNFTHSQAVDDQIEQYRKQSNSVQLFLDDESYEKSIGRYEDFKSVYSSYRTYCLDSGYRPVAKRTFSERLKAIGIETERKNFGIVVYLRKRF